MSGSINNSPKISDRLITSFQKKFKLFKPPNRIGDIIEYDDTEYLIIGIEKVVLSQHCLLVTYTCQNLTIFHTVPPTVNINDDMVEFYSDVDITKLYDDKDWLFKQRDNLNSIGRVFEHKNNYYRSMTYTDLEFNFTTLRVSILAQIIRPMTVESSKKYLLNHKKKKIGLSLISKTEE